MAVIMYRSTDAGATQLDYTNTVSPVGRFYTAIKQILITGYGTRTPIGHWTIEFDDPANFTMVLRHKNGTRFLRIKDDQSSIMTEVRGYTSMSDIDTGEGAFPNLQQIGATTQPVFQKRGSNSTAASDQNWYCVADSEGDWFYWFCTTGASRTDTSGYFFGVLEKLPGDTVDRFHNACIGSNINGAGVGFIQYMFRVSTSISQQQYTDVALAGYSSVNTESGSPFQGFNPYGAPQEFAPNLVRPHYVSETFSDRAIGKFPGLFRVQNNGDLIFDSADRGELITSNGVMYLLLDCASGGYFWCKVDQATG